MDPNSAGLGGTNPSTPLVPPEGGPRFPLPSEIVDAPGAEGSDQDRTADGHGRQPPPRVVHEAPWRRKSPHPIQAGLLHLHR